RPGRITAPEPETVSASEFEQMKRELDVERETPARHTSTLTKRLAQRPETDAPAPAQPKPSGDGAPQAADQPKPPDAAAPPAPDQQESAPAPDLPENEGVARAPKPKRQKSRSRRRHGGRR